jgi:hypothetical protein
VEHRDDVEIHIERITQAADEIAATLERLNRVLQQTHFAILDHAPAARSAPRSPEVEREARARDADAWGDA